MTNLYNDKDFIKQTIQVIKDQLDDLEKIDAHNGDKFNDEIVRMEELVEKIKYE